MIKKKYRVIEVGGWYYPQRRVWGVWCYYKKDVGVYCHVNLCFQGLDEALQFIRTHPDGPNTVVWEGRKFLRYVEKR